MGAWETYPPERTMVTDSHGSGTPQGVGKTSVNWRDHALSTWVSHFQLIPAPRKRKPGVARSSDLVRGARNSDFQASNFSIFKCWQLVKKRKTNCVSLTKRACRPHLVRSLPLCHISVYISDSGTEKENTLYLCWGSRSLIPHPLSRNHLITNSFFQIEYSIVAISNSGYNWNHNYSKVAINVLITYKQNVYICLPDILIFLCFAKIIISHTGTNLEAVAVQKSQAQNN